jgi:hypothetical protein
MTKRRPFPGDGASEPTQRSRRFVTNRSSIIKSPVRPTLPEGPYCTVEQAIDFILHRNDGPRRMHEIASVFRPEDRAPDVFAALGTYRTPRQILEQENRARAVFEAFQTLRQEFATGVVRSIKNDRVLSPAYWRVDPTQQVAEDFTAATHGFRKLIADIELSTEEVCIPVADLVKAFEPTPATADTPKPKAARKGKKPKPAEEPLTPEQRKIKAGLLQLYPKGPDAYDAMLHGLRAAKVKVSRTSLVRVLSKMPTEWRKKR